jgi:hypothetical protein
MSTTDPNRGARILTREQRDALYKSWVMAMDAGSIDMQFVHGGGRGARETADNARLWMRLLDDLGWERDDERDSFPITMPDEQLLPLIRRELEEIDAELRQVAEGEVRSEEDGRWIADQDLDARSACCVVLEWSPSP